MIAIGMTAVTAAYPKACRYIAFNSDKRLCITRVMLGPEDIKARCMMDICVCLVK
ncbi:MAG: hypothetical protein A4E35_00282 [Methanoregula sp. PtaU1.Bin051]|nr:MAG: hypothetical protein A4E35_00282 [Methanoregula sp. PtaU1.Bin051]